MIITKRLQLILEFVIRISEWLFEILEIKVPKRRLIRIPIGIGFLILYLSIGLPILFLFYLTMCSEYFISRLILRYSIEVDFTLETKEWLKKETKYWKIMEYSLEPCWPLLGKDNEVRFLTKNEALKFKMVWG